MLVWSILPGQWPNQIVKNLFALINVKENGRSEGMSRCNCGRKNLIYLDLTQKILNSEKL